MFKKPKHIVFITLLLVIAIILIGVGVYAKYITTVNLSGTVSFTANLAESIQLFEHKADKQPDGSYLLDMNVIAYVNEYDMMPGVDVPKDPQIVITGKTAADAYLYIEVVSDTFPATVSFSIDDHWLELTILGPHGGRVYVYSEDKSTPSKLTTGFTSDPLFILKDNKLTVSESYSEGPAFSANMTFYAYMAQHVPPTSVEDLFTTCFLPTP